MHQSTPSPFMQITIMRILTPQPDDIILHLQLLPCNSCYQGETLLLTLFRFVARAIRPFLAGRIYRAVSRIGISGFPELPVKQPITKGGSRIHLSLKEMKIGIIRFLRSPLSFSIV